MRGISFLKANLFRGAVLVGICIILYYTIGTKLVSNQNSVKLGGEKKQKVETITDNNVKTLSAAVDTNEALDKDNNKTPVTGVNNVKLAEVNGDEQTVVMESNEWQLSQDVILVQKGTRTKWIFKLKNGEDYSGKIFIKKLGLIIPITEKEKTLSFIPWKDFTVTSEQNKFNYYIKVVEKLGLANDKIVGESKNLQKTIPQKQNPKTKTGNQKTTKPNNIEKPAIPSSNELQKASEGTNTPVAEQETKKDSSEETKNPTPSEKEVGTKQPENSKKGGLLDHLFHHH